MCSCIQCILLSGSVFSWYKLSDTQYVNEKKPVFPLDCLHSAEHHISTNRGDNFIHRIRETPVLLVAKRNQLAHLQMQVVFQFSWYEMSPVFAAFIIQVVLPEDLAHCKQHEIWNEFVSVIMCALTQISAQPMTTLPEQTDHHSVNVNNTKVNSSCSSIMSFCQWCVMERSCATNVPECPQCIKMCLWELTLHEALL